MNTPVTTTVIYIEVPLSGDVARGDVTANFERTVAAAAAQIGSITKEHGGPQLAVTLPPGASVGGPLQVLCDAFAAFNAASAPVRVRGVAHYGTVFRSEAGGKVSYLGSAIRSAQSALKRSDASGGLLATREFAAYANGFTPPAVPLLALPNSPDGFHIVRLEARAAGPGAKTGGGLSSSDPEFLAFIKKRLAEDLGPFASAMVENGRRSTATAPLLVADLAREIDNADARKRFEADLAAYIKQR